MKMWQYHLQNSPAPSPDDLPILQAIFKERLRPDIALSLLFALKHDQLPLYSGVVDECIGRGADVYKAHWLAREQSLVRLRQRLDATVRLLDPQSHSPYTLYSCVSWFPDTSIYQAVLLVAAYETRDPTQEDLQCIFGLPLEDRDRISGKSKALRFFASRFHALPNCMIAFAAHYRIHHPRLDRAPVAVDTSAGWFGVVKPLLDVGRVVDAVKYVMECVGGGASPGVHVFVPGHVELSAVEHVILNFPPDLKLLFLMLMFPDDPVEMPVLSAVSADVVQSWIQRAIHIRQRLHHLFLWLQEHQEYTAIADLLPLIAQHATASDEI